MLFRDSMHTENIVHSILTLLCWKIKSSMLVCCSEHSLCLSVCFHHSWVSLFCVLYSKWLKVLDLKPHLFNFKHLPLSLLYKAPPHSPLPSYPVTLPSLQPSAGLLHAAGGSGGSLVPPPQHYYPAADRTLCQVSAVTDRLLLLTDHTKESSHQRCFLKLLSN